MSSAILGRRGFLKLAAGAAGVHLAAPMQHLLAGEPPPVTSPRATDGDERHEPDWDERLTITVGPKSADLVGRTDKVIQAAVDYVARLGGGTVKLLPGTFTLRAAVWLASGIRIQGSGPETIVTKIPSTTVELAADSDWYDQEITLADGKSFRVGDSILLRAKKPDGGDVVIKRTIVARSGNRLKLNDGLRENLWLSGRPTCSSLFPLLTSERTAGVTIEDLALDGNGRNNANLDGNYAGCVFLQDCNRYVLRRVEARNYNGDGISFQICHDVEVHDCHSHDHTGLALHPGSGSQRPLIRGNTLSGSRIGLFWCWGVKYGLAEGNRMEDNRDYGISIGHNDTDNLMRDNLVRGSGKVGVLFRDERRGEDFWPNRNRLEKNRIVDSGGEQGIAIDVQGKTHDVAIVGNELRETRAPMKRTAVRISAEARHIDLSGNTIEGFAQDVRDQRAAG